MITNQLHEKVVEDATQPIRNTVELIVYEKLT